MTLSLKLRCTKPILLKILLEMQNCLHSCTKYFCKLKSKDNRIVPTNGANLFLFYFNGRWQLFVEPLVIPFMDLSWLRPWFIKLPWCCLCVMHPRSQFWPDWACRVNAEYNSFGANKSLNLTMKYLLRSRVK